MKLKPLIVPGELESLNAIAEFIITTAQLACLDKKTTYKLRLAVDEIATNIIQYGYADTRGKITCYAKFDRNYLTIILEDWGLAYEPLKYSQPIDLEQPLTTRIPGGLGIYLALNSVDDFQYERVGDLNRHFFRVKKLPK